MPFEAFQPDALSRAFDPTRLITPSERSGRSPSPLPPNHPAVTRGELFDRLPPPMAPMPAPPTPPSTGGAGGGGGVGGRSLDFDAAAGMGAIRRAQDQAAAAAAALDGMFEQRMQHLREMYQFEESPEEKARIQHLHNIIQVQREEGTKVIERVYGSAIEGAAARSAEVREMGAEAGQRTRETFQGAAEDTTEMLGELNERFGGAMGAGGEPLSPVAEAAVSDLQRQAEIEAAFDERMFGVTADDISVLGEAMRPEMGAQVGALQRTATEASAIGQMQHDRDVSSRIAAERQAYSQAMQQLAMMFDQRRFGLEDQQIGLQSQLGQMQQQASQFGAGLRAQQAQAGPTFDQQMAWEQQQQQFERELEMWQRQQEVAALRGLGVAGPQATHATTLGLGQGLAGQILQQQFAPDLSSALGL